MLTQVTTEDGQMQAVYIATETAESRTLKDTSGNPEHPIANRQALRGS